MSEYTDSPNHPQPDAGLPEAIPIPLTRGYVAFVDAEDADLASWGWYASKTTKAHYRPYAQKTTRPNGPPRQRVELYLHRIIMQRILGRTLVDGERVDHIDGDPLNNARGNLRLATHQQNMQNRKRNVNNASGYKGVRYSERKGMWWAAIGVDGKNRHLGYFDTAEEAHKAYVKVAEELYGEFANPG